MERFAGQELGPRPHMAIVFSDGLGDFMTITPMLRGLKEKYPDSVVDYFGGERTKELELACPYIDSRFSVFGLKGNGRSMVPYVRRRESLFGPYDLAINFEFHSANSPVTNILAPRYVVGSCYRSDGRQHLEFGGHVLDALCQEEWSKRDLVTRYGATLRTGFMGEILCRIARVDTDFYREEAPKATYDGFVPPILINIGGKRQAKLWPVEHWVRLVRDCEARGSIVGLLGESPAGQAAHHRSAPDEEELLRRTRIVDLRGKLSLPQITSALKRALICVTIDNGIMHMSAAAGTPTIALFGASAWWQWAPPVANLSLVLSKAACDLCERHDFKNEACFRDDHICMESIGPETVVEMVDDILLERLGTTGGD